MKQLSFHILFFVLINCSSVYSQQFSFDNGVIAPFQVADANKSELTLVSAPYKDGNLALQWLWSAPATLKINSPVTFRNFRDGVIFWVYNETPRKQPLIGEFLDENNITQYVFHFGLDFQGWRICRIGSKYMTGEKRKSTNLILHLHSPQQTNQGRIFIDRFSYVADVNYQNAPDAQQPNNTENNYINHWNSLWKWESENIYDLSLVETLTAEQKQSLQKIDLEILSRLPKSANTSLINSAKNQFSLAKIRKTDGFWIGSPLVVKPDKLNDDIALSELGNMMLGFALDSKFNSNAASKQNYIDLWDYALSQGFAFGSAMGNNHHYGYETRQIFQAAYLMKDVLIASGQINDVAATLSFWSGLPETRTSYNNSREGVVDTWNTLLLPRLIAAMLIQDLPQQFRAAQSLVRWVNGSLEFTPGNLGGIKPDGTIFHHAGHYPAYGVGGFAGLGDFIGSLLGSEFRLSNSAHSNLALSLFAMSQYTHLYDWSIGMSGRHPHDGSMSNGVIETFGLLALMGGNYQNPESLDSKLAKEYVRLETENTSIKQYFTGISANQTPAGFFVFNHAAAGVHRVGNSMVTIKGYNSDVWGSEIYTNDNRYGRYQSYGAVEIMNEGSPVSRKNSRINEAGWDWNRLPGTTTIHLPLTLLESPVTSTLMARSKEDFAGSSSLLGEFGIFGMKLWEQNAINNTNYTPDFKARKSVFTFGKRLVCIGTDIQNSNAQYPTETTFFQQSITNAGERFSVNGTFNNALGFNYDAEISENPTSISDLSGNFYRVSGGNKIKIEGKEQISKQNKTRVETKGNFLTAWINHGNKPTNSSYEYLIMLKPTPAEQKRWNEKTGYEVWQKDFNAHIVHDTISNVTGYVAFENTIPAKGLIQSISAETLVMMKQTNDENLVLSVCDPSLRLPVKTNNSDNTMLQSVETTKEIFIDGHWQLKENHLKVTTNFDNEKTKISVKCQFGLPVEFELKKIQTSVPTEKERNPIVYLNKNEIHIDGFTKSVILFDVSGRMIEKSSVSSDKKIIPINSNGLFLMIGKTAENKQFIQKIII